MGRASCRPQGDKQYSMLALSSSQPCQICPGRQQTLGDVSMLRNTNRISQFDSYLSDCSILADVCSTPICQTQIHVFFSGSPSYKVGTGGTGIQETASAHLNWAFTDVRPVDSSSKTFPYGGQCF